MVLWSKINQKSVIWRKIILGPKKHIWTVYRLYLLDRLEEILLKQALFWPKMCIMVLWLNINQKSVICRKTILSPKKHIWTVYRLYFLNQLEEIATKQALSEASNMQNGALLKRQPKSVICRKMILGSKMQIWTVYKLYC